MDVIPPKLRRLFLGVLVIFALVLMILYVSETQDFGRSPYLTHIKNVVRDSENLVANYTVGKSRRRVTEAWTYDCVQNKCTKVFHEPNATTIRVPFLTCAMVCGTESKIWPQPKTVHMKKTFKSFDLTDMQYKVETQHANVADLVHKAMALFVSDIQQVMRANGGKFDENRRRSADEEATVVNIVIEIEEHAETTLTMNSNECYSLSIMHERDTSTVNVTIAAKAYFGARHALETLQQLIWYDDAVDSLRIMADASVNDCPRFNYRGLMLDTSRHYFSVGTIKRIINGMSKVKLNRFHWHITDSQSFPFVSLHFPELAIYGAYSARDVYTHKDVRDIVEFAEVRGIQVIPEIDAPAHSGNGWQWGDSKGLGDLSLCINQQPWGMYCGEPPCGQLNPRNNNTYMVLEKLYSELLSLTKTTDFFHLGGDEVNFECWRQHFKGADLKAMWCDFLLEAHARLMAANNDSTIRHTTVWNSNFNTMQCLPPENFTIQVWLAQPSELQRFLNAGYNIVVSHVDAWYLDCGFGAWRGASGSGSCPPFKAWYTVYNYQPWHHIKEDHKKKILGGEACMWTEAVDEDSVDSRIWPRATALAERLWTDPLGAGVPMETITRFSMFHTRFLDLGLKSDAIWPEYCTQNMGECT